MRYLILGQSACELSYPRTKRTIAILSKDTAHMYLMVLTLSTIYFLNAYFPGWLIHLTIPNTLTTLTPYPGLTQALRPSWLLWSHFAKKNISGLTICKKMSRTKFAIFATKLSAKFAQKIVGNSNLHYFKTIFQIHKILEFSTIV